MLVKRGRPRKRDRGAKTIVIRVRLSEEEHDELVDTAMELGVTLSEIVRRALGIFFDMRRY